MPPATVLISSARARQQATLPSLRQQEDEGPFWVKPGNDTAARNVGTEGTAVITNSCAGRCPRRPQNLSRYAQETDQASLPGGHDPRRLRQVRAEH
jgi:hypothetical protein